jgi:hypothetical protein
VPSLSTRLHHRHESEELNPIYSSDRDLSQPEGAGIDLFVCRDQLRKGQRSTPCKSRRCSSHAHQPRQRPGAITVLWLDGFPLEPSRSFHDVLLPRLVLACTADVPASGRAWSIRSASLGDSSLAVAIRRSSSRTKGGHRVFG